MERIMVNMARVNTKELAQETEMPEKDVEKIVGQIINNRNNNKKPLKQKPPEGSIIISQASRKYNLPRTTIHEWIKGGHIAILLKTGKEKYIDEKIISLIAARYDTKQGRGNRQIKEIISDLTNMLNS